MAEIKELQTEFIYPAFEFKHWETHEPGKYKFSKPKKIEINLHITTYIRKKYRNVWYLLPVAMKADYPIYDMKKKKVLEEGFIAEFLKAFYLAVYKHIMFYIISAEMINPYHIDHGRIAIYKDADQRSEEERLGIKKKE